MTNSEYWRNRFKALEQTTFEHTEEWLDNADRQFRKSLITIKDKIAWFYTLFESDTGLNFAESKRALDTKSLKEFKLTVDEYIKLGKSLNEHFDRSVYKQMEIASLRVRISRYEAIKWFIEAEIARLYGELNADAYENLGQAYENRYYQTAYEMRELGTSFAKLNKKQIKVALEKPWQDAVFSETIWNNRDKLKKSLTDVITQSIIQGKGYTDTTLALEKRMHVGNSNCARIITTEMAAISSKAQQDMFGELGVKKYEIVATLDTHTSQICQSLDGKIFNQKDYQVGVTAPPFHPRCRTTCTPLVDGFKNAERIARDKNGKSVYVKNQSYLDWAKENDIEPIYGLWEPEKDYSTVSNKGARITDIDSIKAQNHAELYYNTVRHRKYDYTKIAKNTPFREKDLKAVQEHIFVKEHWIWDNERQEMRMRTFYTAFDIAQSWQRLYEGTNIQKHDITLLNHEMYELTLMKYENLEYEEAHKQTEKIYNYAKESKEYYDYLKKHKSKGEPNLLRDVPKWKW